MDRIELLSRAFDLVCPRKRAEKLVTRGLITAEDCAHVTWRDAIAATLLPEHLEAAGATLADVCAAIEHYTATEAVVRREPISGVCGEVYNPPRPGFLILAAGYRNGPAGP